MKKWKKNWMAVAVLVTVCSGIYLNWVYSGGKDTQNLEQTINADKVMNDDLLILDGNNKVEVNTETNTTNYFAAVRLSRQEARDSAVSLLQEAMAYGSQEQVEKNNAQLEQIIQYALSEAQIESLVIAKGYADCVAYITENGISVAVAAPEGGLQSTDVAVIADVVLSQSDFTMNDIRVVEVP
jgi:stage III sporulation protein AH